MASLNNANDQKSKSFIKKGFGKLKDMLSTKEQKLEVDFKPHMNLVFNELSRFV